jgi:serine/threonine-protein kinase
MALAESEVASVRSHLEGLLASPKFARSERLSQFLRFIVERHLQGRDAELKESVIALEVFGKSDYDPKQDSMVRTEAGRLRARLAEYYLGEGSGETVIIELPKGGYVPVIRRPEKISIPENTPRKRYWLPAALVAAVLVLAVSASWILQSRRAPIAIAVPPFHNLSPDAGSDYFSDGLTDEIIRDLSIIDGLAVRSQTSSFSFKGKPRNVHEFGKELDVGYILEGSVLKSGKQLRINAQFVRVRDDVPLWSGQYDRELTDVFAIQEEISRGIVNSLRLKLGRGRRRYETSTEAYDLYLRARALGHQYESIDLFEKAISKDPAFAPAYAGLAGSYAFDSGTMRRDQTHAEDLPRMRAAAEKAIQLDPMLAEAHAALGTARARDAQWGLSEKSFRRANELDPNSSQAHVDFAMYLLLPLGRVEEAVGQMRYADSADPLSPKVQEQIAYVLLAARRFEEASQHCRKAGGDGQAECLGRVSLGQGKIEEAVRILAGVSNPRYYGHALGRAGRREEAEKLAATIATHPFQQALIYAGLGDKDRTLDALDRMTVLGPVRIGMDLMLPELAIVRGDPRMHALRRKVGLPE